MRGSPLIHTHKTYHNIYNKLKSVLIYFLNFSANVFTQRSEGRIGKVYKKAVYVEYEDASFMKQKPTTDRTRHLGLLGPFIRAEEGDEIVIVAKNMASRNYSINPRGLFYRL